jgi:hypothetical protein
MQTPKIRDRYVSLTMPARLWMASKSAYLTAGVTVTKIEILTDPE